MRGLAQSGGETKTNILLEMNCELYFFKKKKEKRKKKKEEQRQ